jgi:flagellar assembly factor FliW
MNAMAILEKSVRPQNKNTIIHFDEGLIGFSECKDFQVMENETLAPFRLLQSAEMNHIGFMVLEPTIIMSDYYKRIPAREWESIGLSPKDPLLAFVICIIGPSTKNSTGNFQAPLIVDYKKMIGRQVILTDTELSVRQPLT